MTTDDDIFDALRPLAGRSTAAERDGLTSDVDAMVAVFPIVREPSMTKTTSRRKSIATMVAAGIIGFGGVAAAGPLALDALDGETATTSSTTTEPDEMPETTLVGDDDTSTDTSSSTTTSTTVAPTTTAAPPTSTASTTTVAPGDDTDELAAELEDDPDTAFDETKCADGNHGKTVSSVAKATEGPNKGQTVRDAAHSSCGKKTDNDADADDADDHDDDADDHGESDADKSDDGADDKSKTAGNGQGSKSSRDDAKSSDDKTKTKTNSGNSGNGNGNGNGKTKGK